MSICKLLDLATCLYRMQIFGYLILSNGMEPKQVERVFGTSHPDPVEMEKAKKVLKVRINRFL